ncbi:hypothetical protein [Mucilaginibacter sp. OK268]
MVYECNPMAFIVEQAGVAESTRLNNKCAKRHCF